MKREKERTSGRFRMPWLCSALGALAGLAFGIVYFIRNPQEIGLSIKLYSDPGGAVIGACLVYMMLGGGLAGAAYERYQRRKWKREQNQDEEKRKA